ncbi:MAG: magnesium/cobalt transporter CorA [Saprospiraceae bacterium]|nr:magnesium/cobalt transporter CorA [Saprospiraceae bacterium]
MKIEKHKKHKKRLSKSGLPPGTHIYTGKIETKDSEIEIFSYSENQCTRKILGVGDSPDLDPSLNHWINIIGLSDHETVKKYCDLLGVHYLYQEDILNVFQRPKAEEEDGYIFTTMKAIEWNSETKELNDEQISIVLSNRIVITFQERPGDYFGQIRDGLISNGTIIREKDIDYLFYRLIDVTVDIYFDILEKLGDYLEEVEDIVLGQPGNGLLIMIQNNKKDIMMLRKMIYPMRDMISKIVSSEHKLIEERTKKYFKDVQDHTIQIMETIETYRDINYSLKDLYLNAMSHEMNRIMKILTIISTFFIPLTFIVGVYGMNFKYMPELNWLNGYYIVWILMLSIVIFLTFWFKRKGWF